MRGTRVLTVLIPLLALAACGQGDGPESIANDPAPPLPPVAPNFCDAINFELQCPDPGIVNFNGGATIVVDNPDQSGLNTSDRVARMQKYPDEVFGGTLLDLGEAIDFSKGEFYKVKVWSPRAVTVSFKLEEQGNPAGGFTKEQDHTGGSEWQELCFDFTGQAVPTPVVALTIIFDNGVLGRADTDPDNWTFYYDDIEKLASCEGGGGGAITPDAALYATTGAPDLVIPDDYEERTPFGSGSVIDEFYADDGTYSPVLSVYSGVGYGANIAQVGFTGFRPGFLGAYETVDFKVKGMPNFVIFVKLFDGLDALRINLTSSDYSTELVDGWYQVSIPVSRFADVGEATGIVFESDDTAPEQFRMLLTDIGFSGVCDNPPEIADPGTVPDAVVYASDPDVVEDLAYPGLDTFGSGAVFDADFGGDFDFNPAFQVTSGEGYGAGVHVGFVAFVGYGAGFASGYGTLDFKVQADAANLAAFEAKFFAPDASVVIDVPSYAGTTALGNGWYQVSIPLSEFGDAAAIAGFTGFLLGPQGDQGAAFSFLLTDIGLSGTAAAEPGIIPDAVVYASDPNVVEDLAFPGLDTFGSGAVFEAGFAGDPDFNPAFQVISGDLFGGADVGFVAFVGYPAGFASGYENLVFKVKADVANLGAFEAKFFVPDSPVVIDVVNYAGTTVLGNGWYQVVIPMSEFGDAATIAGFTGFLLGPQGDQGAPFSFLLTDIGFSGTAGGPASSPDSIIPQTVLFATDPNVPVDLVFGVDYTGITAFTSGSVLNEFYADDPDFNPVFAVTSGAGYGANVGQLAFDGFAPGFATGFGTLEFKVKGMPGDLIRVKFLYDGDYLDVALLDPTYSTPLGNDWYQVQIPVSAFTGVDTATGLLFESNNTSPVQFTFLLTDIGFSGTADSGGELLANGDFEASADNKDPWINAGGVVANNYYTVQANEGGNVFDTNLSQVLTITPGADYVLTFRAKASVNRTMLAGIGLNEAPWYAALVSVPLTTEWQSFSYNLSANNDADGVPFGNANSRVLFDMGTVASTVDIDDVSLTLADGGGGIAGDIAVNGSFETGDFTGWQQFDGGAIQAITNVNPSVGTFAANLNIPVIGAGGVGVDNLIKNANLEAGNLAAGAAVTVSFDMRGSLSGDGGVVFAELFSELAGGGTSKAEILGGGALAPAAAWTPYTFNTTLGPDVAGGVTLQLKVGCGAVEGCGADVYFDNVSVVIN
jgi:hypothetical protein